MAVDEFDGLAAVVGTAAAEADDTVEFAGSQYLGACHNFMVLGVGGYLVKHRGSNPCSLQHALDGLDNAGALQAGGYDQGIGHTESFGVIADHCMCTPA